MAVTANAVVIGGGVMGASILYNLAERGVDAPLLLERDTLGSGSTGRSSGAIRMHYSTEVNARLAWESLRVFQNWGDAVGGDGDPGFVRTGYMVIAPDHEADGFHHNIKMQQQAGIDTRIVNWQEAKELAPDFHLGENEHFAWEEQSGHGDPSGTALAFTTRARELGGIGRAGISRDRGRSRRRPRGRRTNRHSGVRDRHSGDRHRTLVFPVLGAFGH